MAIDPKEIKASILLNKLRLVAIFDVILELKNFIFDKLEETPEEGNKFFLNILESDLKSEFD